MVEPHRPALMPRVVVVEDDPAVRFAQQLLLQDWGYQVVAGNSSAVIESALDGTSGEIAAIIADYHLGGPETGVEIALQIAQRSNRKIPTLLLSGSFGRNSSAAAKKHGFSSLPKPAKPEELRGWLASVVAA